MPGRIVVLLSDFGASEYVGAMKGVILSKNRNVTLIDLTHTISPQTIVEGAWVLLQNYKLFPKETVFLCVIDPGVGGQRDAVVVITEDYFFIGPDNGLLYPAASDDGIKAVIGKLKDQEGDSEMDEKILEKLGELFTLCQSMQGTMEKTFEMAENIMKRFEEKGKEPPPKEGEDDEDMDKDKEKSLQEQVTAIAETVKAQGENITKMSEVLVKLVGDKTE